MKNKDFKHIILFILVFFVLNYIINIFFVKAMMNETRIGRQEKQFDKTQKKLKYLVMGDSHSQDGINPNVLGDSFNYASNSEAYIDVYYKLKFLFDNRTRDVDAIILPIDFHTFSPIYHNLKLGHEWFWIRYIDYLEVGRESGMYLRYFCKMLRGKFFPYAKQRRYIMRLIEANKKKTPLEKGHIPWDIERGRKFLRKSASVNVESHYKYRLFIDDIFLKYFYKTLDLCKINNKKVVLIRYPVSKEYYDEFKKTYHYSNGAEEKINGIIQDVIQKYSNVEFIDCIDLYFDEVSYFYDSDHLNKNGAVIFTEYIRSKLKDE